MRVAQVIGKLADGGVEAVVNNYCRHTDAGRVGFDYYIDDDSERTPPREMRERGARYFTVPNSHRVVARVRALTRLFRENGYTIVHAHMNTLNAPVLYAAWRAGVPVRISHNHSTGSAQEWKRAALKGLLRLTGGWFATSRMACGEAAGRWFFGNRAFDRGAVDVLPNAIDVDRYRFDPAARHELREALGAGDALVVGHAGRFMPQKNHAFALAIFRALREKRPDAVLWLVGDGELRARTEALAGQLGIAGAVRFLGSRGDLNRLYSAMDCFTLPSLYEGTPLVAVEAQAAGLPCCLADNITREVALLDSARYLPLTAAPEAWADAILAGAAPPDDARRDAAARMRGSRFDLEVSGAMLERYYENECRRLTGTTPWPDPDER